MQILEFFDNSQIEVKAIFGGPKLVNNMIRDTLRIEVDPSTIGFDDLKAKFKDNPNTGMLYTYSESPNEDGVMESHKTIIGEGYKIFVSISNEEREIPHMPGLLVPPQKEEVYVITIAQQTYEEHLADVAGLSQPG